MRVAEMPNQPVSIRARQKLQWGRDLRVAEMKKDREKTYLVVELQWGRDLRVAEIAMHPADAGRRVRGFNGAAT